MLQPLIFLYFLFYIVFPLVLPNSFFWNNFESYFLCAVGCGDCLDFVKYALCFYEHMMLCRIDYLFQYFRRFNLSYFSYCLYRRVKLEFVTSHISHLFLQWSDTIQIWQEYDVEDSMLPLQPSLNYTAPELVRSKAASVGCYSDIFSFGCLAYHLIAHKSLFDCHNNVKMVCFGLSYFQSACHSQLFLMLV